MKLAKKSCSSLLERSMRCRRRFCRNSSWNAVEPLMITLFVTLKYNKKSWEIKDHVVLRDIERLDDFSQKISQKIWRRRLYSKVIPGDFDRIGSKTCSFKQWIAKKRPLCRTFATWFRILTKYSFEKINLYSEYVLWVSMFYCSKCV